MPSVRLVDLRREAGYPLSAPLLAELSSVAERGGRAILLLNRRVCRVRSTAARAASRAAAQLRHRARPCTRDARLHCHHCGFSIELPPACPECGSVELARIGAGTQRLEAELARRVPRLERIRLDADTAATPGALREALERFANARAGALIGTQMVAKGHHFPGVEVAAVVDADAGLAFPDFRAEERTFQLVTQLAGRSGRDAPGQVIVQTFQPDATPFTFALRHDVSGFLAQELVRRRELSYPPFSHLVALVVSGPDPTMSVVRFGSCGGARGTAALGCSAPRPCCGSEAAIALSCSRRPPRRAPSRAGQQRCSRVPRRPCAGTA